MKIDIIIKGVSAPEKVPNKKGGGYNVVSLDYLDKDELKTTKFFDFANPDLFKRVQEFKKGDRVAATLEKPEGEKYWRWTGVDKVGEGEFPEEPAKAAVGAVPAAPRGNTYETHEERAAKQKYIVLQTCLERAVEVTDAVAGERDDIDLILRTADAFYNWIQRRHAGNVEDQLPDVPQ